MVAAVGLALFLASSRDATRIRSHFGIRLPAGATILARRIDTFGFDGSVAWVVRLHESSEALRLVPEGFAELTPTDDWSSKYQEVLGHFKGQLPSAFSGFGKTRVFLGGPDGNSFIGISEAQDRIILYRFWI
jgi:hypothetical protein